MTTQHGEPASGAAHGRSSPPANPDTGLPGSSRFVVLIDWENLSLSKEERLDVTQRLLDMLGDRVRVAKAFASDFAGASGRLTRMGVHPVSEPRLKADKNVTDMALASHAFEEAVHDVTVGVRSTFVIVSGDSDFYLLARSLRGQRFPVVGVLRGDGATKGLERWYDITVPLSKLRKTAPAEEGGAEPKITAARGLLLRAGLPALDREQRRLLGEALLKQGGGSEAEVVAALAASTQLDEAEITRWLSVAAGRGGVRVRRGRVELAGKADEALLGREVDAQLVRRLRQQKKAFEQHAALGEVLGFADLAGARAMVVDAVNGWDVAADGPLDAGRMRHELMQAAGVEPWFLGYGRVRRFFDALHEDGLIQLVQRGSSLTLQPVGTPIVEPPEEQVSTEEAPKEDTAVAEAELVEADEADQADEGVEAVKAVKAVEGESTPVVAAVVEPAPADGEDPAPVETAAVAEPAGGAAELTVAAADTEALAAAPEEPQAAPEPTVAAPEPAPDVEPAPAPSAAEEEKNDAAAAAPTDAADEPVSEQPAAEPAPANEPEPTPEPEPAEAPPAKQPAAKKPAAKKAPARNPAAKKPAAKKPAAKKAPAKKPAAKKPAAKKAPAKKPAAKKSAAKKPAAKKPAAKKPATKKPATAKAPAADTATSDAATTPEKSA